MAAKRRKPRYPETIILRVPKGTKSRIAKAHGPLVTQTEYVRQVLLDYLSELDQRRNPPETD